jgi:hypothetical protein
MYTQEIVAYKARQMASVVNEWALCMHGFSASPAQGPPLARSHMLAQAADVGHIFVKLQNLPLLGHSLLKQALFCVH